MNLSRTTRLCAFVLAIAVPTVMVAQFEAATVLGTIRDTSGAVVPNCKVTLENVKTGITVPTNTDGNGIFAPPGMLSSNSSGFGVFSSTFPARQVQLALKLVF